MSYFVRRYGRTMPIPSQTGAEARAVPAASGGRGRKPGIPEPVRPASRTLASPERSRKRAFPEPGTLATVRRDGPDHPDARTNAAKSGFTRNAGTSGNPACAHAGALAPPLCLV